MSFFSLIGLKIKQIVGGEGVRGLVKFLAPDFLVGFFLAISSPDAVGNSLPFRVAVVSTGVTLFTLLAESRKFFFSGGDVEGFYFVRPTSLSRVASATGLLVIDFSVTGAIFVPVTIISQIGRAYPADMLSWYVISVFFSVSVCFILLFAVAILPGIAANRALTLIQVAMALLLLAAFQLSARFQTAVSFDGLLRISTVMFAVTFFIFALFSFSEQLVVKLNEITSGNSTDLITLAGKFRPITFSRSGEEEAGFLFFLTNLFRNSQFRLSTVGVAGTPMMVAVYWSMQRRGLLRFDVFPGLTTADLVAPIASLVVSGIIVYYFLSQNVLSTRDYDAVWQFRTCGRFNIGRFVLGIRKALLLTVHVPITILVFAVLAVGNPIASSLLAAATFYLMGHIAISWFSIMQKDFPFSLPYTRLGATVTANIAFMLFYSFLITTLLFFAYGSVQKLLMLNVFAFILVGILEFFSSAIVNKRVKLGV